VRTKTDSKLLKIMVVPRNLLKFVGLLRVFWRLWFLPVQNLFEMWFFPVFIGVCEPPGILPEASNRCSGTLFPQHFR
jgi:hypothetical protein